MPFPGVRRCQFLSSDTDRQNFLEYAMKFLMYQPPSLLHQAAALPQGARGSSTRSTQPQSATRVSSVPLWHTCSRSCVPPLVMAAAAPHLVQACKLEASFGCFLQANGSSGAPGSGHALQETAPDAAPPVPPGLCPADVKEIEGKHPPEGAVAASVLKQCHAKHSAVCLSGISLVARYRS